MVERVRMGRPGENVTDGTRSDALADCTESFIAQQQAAEVLKTLKAEHSNRLKKWKGRGVHIDALKMAVKDRLLDPDDVLKQLHEYTRFRALQNMPTIQTDLVSMWTEVDVDQERKDAIQNQRWHDDGAFAGRQGNPRESNPWIGGTEAYRQWDAGWLEDQERIAKAMGAGETPAEVIRGSGRKKAAGRNGASVTPAPARKRRRAAADADQPAA